MRDTSHKAAVSNRAMIKNQHLMAGIIILDEYGWCDNAGAERLLSLVNASERYADPKRSELILVHIKIKVFQANLESVFVLSGQTDSIFDLPDHLLRLDPPPLNF
jgi:hypothetical protein